MKKLNFAHSRSVKDQRSLNRWIMISIFAFITLGILLGAVHLYYSNQCKKLSVSKAKIQSRIERLEPAVAQKKKLLQKEETVRNQLGKRMYLTDMQENPGLYLQELARLIPAHAVIESFTREAKKKILIQGSAKNAQSVTQFLERLNNSKHFTNMHLKYIEPGKEKLLQFKIEGKLLIPKKQFIESMPAAPQSYSQNFMY